MKMKKNWKRFFTLDRHHAEGFTLVELIVVIAILAILGGVAVPAYSGYVKKANMGVDESLASEIEHAMILAYYDGILQPGASVTVYYGDSADTTKNVYIKTDDQGNDFGATAAMIAAFGESYTSLRLQWDGWKAEMGVAADKETMDHVHASNFNEDNLDDTLLQVQKVVGAASGYFTQDGINDKFTIGSNLAAYLDKAGVDYSNGINASNAEAVANAMVFNVADNISNSEMTQNDFIMAWGSYSGREAGDTTNYFTEIGMDPISAAAAEYAAVLSMARYIDDNDPTQNFSGQLTGDSATAEATRLAMLTYFETNTELADGLENTFESDPVAFLGYMDGVTSSADSILANEDLNKSNYFGDGVILSYVNDYISLSDALIAAGGEDGAFVFVLNEKGKVSCLPLDY